MDQHQKLKEIQERLEQVQAEIAKLTQTVEHIKTQIEPSEASSANGEVGA